MTRRSAVIKIGTSSVTDEAGGVDYDVLVNVAADVVALRDDGWTVETTDGLPSAHFEHTVAVGEPPEILTAP